MIKMMIHLGFVLLVLVIISCSNPTEPNKGPGEITKVEVADSLQIPETGNLSKALVQAWVTDPDGLNDVDSVYFYSQKPDGSYANGGNPLSMQDNGKPFSISDPWNGVGDAKAGDGIYALTILMDTNALPGRYIFTFYSRDKKGNLSLSVQDSIEVYN